MGGVLQMKKMMTVGFAALMVAGIAGAQGDVVMVEQDVVMVEQVTVNDAFRPEITAEAALMSAYVWRGQVYNNDAVFQPQLTIEQYGVSFNIWGNYDLGENVNGISSDFSEIDMSLAYSLPIDINEMAFDVGIINYDFPANGDPSGSGVGSNAKSTTELFISATVLSWQDYVIPSVTLFGDIDEAEGTYFLFDIVAPYEVSEYLAVEGGFSAGYGNTAYNDYYFSNSPGLGIASTQDAGWNDFNFYGNATYVIEEGLTVSANLTYTMLEGGSIEDAADSIYESKDKFWGGVNIAYDF
jgi:outer membrane scaffolding protein for murein synthesis (MipA/OmpV family)